MSYEEIFYNLDAAEQSTHNEHYLTEDFSLHECKIFLNSALNVLGLLIINIVGLGDCHILAVRKVYFGPERN